MFSQFSCGYRRPSSSRKELNKTWAYFSCLFTQTKVWLCTDMWRAVSALPAASCSAFPPLKKAPIRHVLLTCSGLARKQAHSLWYHVTFNKAVDQAIRCNSHDWLITPASKLRRSKSCDWSGTRIRSMSIFPSNTRPLIPRPSTPVFLSEIDQKLINLYIHSTKTILGRSVDH